MSDSFKIRETGEGVVLPVRVVPRAKRNDVEGVHDGILRVRLSAPPVDGAANKELIAYIAGRLGCRKRDVEIASGERGRNKTLTIRGVSAADVRRAIGRR